MKRQKKVAAAEDPHHEIKERKTLWYLEFARRLLYRAKDEVHVMWITTSC
jgi:hypothetical protein